MYKFKQNKYTKWYYNIIEAANLRPLISGYIEKHHIIPKSLGGSDKKINIVPLTAREHFIVHLLLIRMVHEKEVYKMVHAIIRFTSKVSNAKEYNLLRKYVSKYSKGKYNKSYGKIWVHDKHTKEIYYVLREEFSPDMHIKGLPYQRGGHKGYVWANDGFNETMMKEELISDGWIKGRLCGGNRIHMAQMSARRHTKEKDLEHSKKLSGSNHFNFGKPAFNRGCIWMTNGIISKMIRKADVDNYMNIGWTKGRLNITNS